MLRLAVFQLLAIYFFVPLLIGVGLVLTAPPGRNWQRTLGWVLNAVGGLAGLAGVPYWIGQYLGVGVPE
ncbi:hypothetical protein [Ramlibacter sp. WS9]|uniref:hypothetical protein n=1 Tax=Ramlibacter sp. WS9 TaxID=1882741 RepID=UPI001143F8B1|nr:hypothetical protein [Ramlibacter sp. WS9]ROZ63412.1 hypothetical protein EEB15_29830 [Ramlibacter sp. WS9]